MNVTYWWYFPTYPLKSKNITNHDINMANKLPINTSTLYNSPFIVIKHMSIPCWVYWQHQVALQTNESQYFLSIFSLISTVQTNTMLSSIIVACSIWFSVSRAFLVGGLGELTCNIYAHIWATPFTPAPNYYIFPLLQTYCQWNHPKLCNIMRMVRLCKH